MDRDRLALLLIESAENHVRTVHHRYGGDVAYGDQLTGFDLRTNYDEDMSDFVDMRLVADDLLAAMQNEATGSPMRGKTR